MLKPHLSLLSGLVVVSLAAACSAPQAQSPQDTSQPVQIQPTLPFAKLTPPEGFGDLVTMTAFQCGETRLETDFHERGIVIASAGLGSFALPEAMAASGAKYEGETDAGHIVFWNKGDEATVWVGKSEWPTCYEENDAMSPSDLMAELTSHEWVVEDLMSAGIPDNAHATLSFTEDGIISGSTGCNRYTGSFKVSNGAITISPLAATKRGCFGGLMDMEQKFLSVMSGTVEADIDATGKLIVSSGGGTLEAR